MYGNAIKSDGYRDNNALAQRNGIGNINYTTPDLTAFFTVTGDDQKLGLPGARLVDQAAGINQLVTDRKGAATPFDYANQQGASATAGFTKTLMNGVDLIVDGGVRDKKQQSGFFGTTPFPSFASTYVSADLTTWSITPRLSVKSLMFGMPSSLLTGVDYYDATFHQDRGAFQDFPPWHRYDLAQQTLAGYFQHTVGVLPTTDFSYGARVQNTNLTARDRFDPMAPFALRHPGDCRSTATRRNMRCMPASSIASTTCSRCSAAPRARSAPPTSTSALRRALPSMLSSIRFRKPSS